MRQKIYRELEELERVAASRRPRACRKGMSPAEVLRRLLSRHSTEPVEGESLAETVARASEIGAGELKGFLAARAQALDP